MPFIITIYEYLVQLYLNIGTIFYENSAYLFPLIISLFTLGAIVGIILKILI